MRYFSLLTARDFRRYIKFIRAAYVGHDQLRIFSWKSKNRSKCVSINIKNINRFL